MELLLVTAGSTSRAALEAAAEARAEGRKVGVLQIVSMWPFPDAEVRALAKLASKILVPEMNLGQISLEVTRAVQGICPVETLQKSCGLAIEPAEILARIKEIDVNA